ncbi:undecaprenyl-diphosphate phosphatase [Nocardioides nematodiphilus]|uniref:undecaprenyl-diphosphate phosphatase n=1 Tax=Nocardioides nematodiphilus TaxID=2849669 RepID=UPI001CD96DFE|nr:undecaprenyl-diphosphate phosphatase [Nocardioides nematodiphilus]MCA1983823.1 undecaprenyl-diphosphate phosphatase [Nocardioides nematodiphilus]
MNYLESVVLGVVEGLTEFLPVSSTGHLTIAEKILGLPIDDDGVTAYTAVIQMGAIAAVVLYFIKDIVAIVRGWSVGLFQATRRGTFEYRMGWYAIVGTIPIGIVGLLAKDLISGPLRSLWWVGGALIVWSGVMLWAERVGKQERGERQLTIKDAIVVGLVQCIALIPGVSRSGATISAGLVQGLDRVTATRLSFFLSIPALTAAGLYELKDVHGISVGVTLVGTLVSFVVAYASVAWLLRFVSHHSIGRFVPYRVVLGTTVLVLVATGVVNAT